jgi:alkylhydroperoxidase/carboxymuconolactone decarboxylase family protein YurZ
VVTTTIEELLRRMALHDEAVVRETLTLRPEPTAAPLVPQRIEGLARLGALIAMDAPVVSYQAAVIDLLAVGATAEDIAGTLVAVAPLVGVARVTSAAPAIAAALGYELDHAFERMDGLASDTT